MSFLSGVELNRAFYNEMVAPIVGSTPHAASLLGPGSDVLGFDTEMSMDHDWGPRLQILVDADAGLSDRLSEGLPRTFRGFPVFYATNDEGTLRMEAEGGRHRVEVTGMNAFFTRLLGVDVSREWTAENWLSVPQQKLLEATADNVFHDDIGLRELQSRFRFFPQDVWLYILASLWQRVGQEEHLVGRCGYVGDEIGAKIMAGRLVRDLMRICFLLERQYFPYPKWFGTAFGRLACAESVTPLCAAVLASDGWEARDSRLAALYEAVAKLQNSAELCEQLPGKTAKFFGRPFQAIHLHSPFAEALRKAINDPALAARPLVGSIDIISDNTDYLCATKADPGTGS